MNIKQIELSGFKSFKNRTVIRFGKGISGIVGPNGCGKSNIIDAFLWVTGETAPGQLRGSVMEEVIFTGTDGRNPSGVAEVSLVLEPSSRSSFPQQYKGMSELMITRRLDRDGKSEYLINSENCRLKDVQDVLVDTGIGRKGVGFIEQGAVEQFISSRPEQKRLLIESTAGILKFRLKKKEAQKKLELSNMHINRLEDVLKQKISQLKKLKKQSEKAVKFRQLKNQIQKQDIKISYSKWHFTQNKRQHLSDKLQKQEDEKQALQTQVEQLNNSTIGKDLELAKEKRHTLQQEYQNLNKMFLSTVEKEQQLERQLLTQERKAYLLKEKHRQSGEQLLLIESHKKEWSNLLEQKQKVKQGLFVQKKQLAQSLEKEKTRQSLLQEDLKKLEAQKATLKQSLREKESQWQKICLQVNSLKFQQSNLEKSIQDSPWDAGMKFVLQQFNNIYEVSVNKFLHVLTPDLKKGVSLLLKGSMQAVFAEQNDIAVSAIEALKKNKAGFCRFILPSKRAGIYQNEQVRNNLKNESAFECFLTDKLQLEGNQWIGQLLESIVVVKDLLSALELKKSYPDWAYVTLRGDVLTAQGELMGGDWVSENNLEVSDKEALTQVVQQLELLQAPAQKLEQELQTVRGVFNKSQQECEEKQALAAKVQQNIWAIMKDQSALENQQSFLVKEITGLENRLKEFNTTKHQLQVENGAVKESVGGSNIQTADQGQKGQIGQEAEQAGQQKHDLEAQIKVLAKKKDDLSKQVSCKEAELANVTKQYEELEQLVSTQQNSLIAKQKEITDNESLISDIKLQLADLENQQNTLESQIQERYHIDLKTIVKSGSNKDHTEKQGTKEGIAECIDFNQLEKAEGELDVLNTRLQGMGDVNLLALKEYEELEKERQFYQKQVEDLCDSKEQLIQVIKRMDSFCSQKFKMVFNEVNGYFSKVFPSLFAGGEAKLVLTDEEEGVDVMVQPPGKKIQNINLLSGGEKAMTAVAVIFSLFLVKPSPFCVLDEVDAPLDDANIVRFSSLLLEMAKVSQIVIITHNKRTMQVCSSLYGVTMEEKGISKILSLDVKNPPSQQPPSSPA